MMYLSREEREERAQRQRREQGYGGRDGTTRNTLVTRPRAKPSIQRNPVAIFLNDVGLGQYAELLISSGFDDMETLHDIEDEHMRDLGLPPGHIVKLKKRLRSSQAVAVSKVPTGMRQPDCTTNQMTTVQMSWVLVKDMGTDVVGEIFYKKFFKAEPESKALFPLSVRARYRDWASGIDEDEDDLDNSPALRKLWAKVIDAVGSAVAGLQDVGKLVPMLQKLGMRHLNYGMKEKYFRIAEKILIEVLKEGLAEKFTPEIEQAWVMVYSFMSATMIAGLERARQEAEDVQRRFSSARSESEFSYSSTPEETVDGTKPAKWLIEDIDDHPMPLDRDGLPLLLKNLSGPNNGKSLAAIASIAEVSM